MATSQVTAMPEQKHDRTKSVKCVRDWRDFTDDYYKLPTDGRQWKSQASKRRQLTEYIATFADGDGSRIKVGVNRMTSKFDVERTTIFRLLDDLRALRALAPKNGLVSEHGCAVRTLTLDAFVERYNKQMETEIAALDAAFEQYQKLQTQKAEVAK
jgi:hypothetical protein